MSRRADETISASASASTKPAAAWGKIQSPVIVNSLEDVMSEQLAEDLNKKEFDVYSKFEQERPFLNASLTPPNIDSSAPKVDHANAAASSNSNLDSDFLLAQLLQHELDKEFDELLKSNEKVKNQNSRVQISYDKFRSVHPINDKQESEINESTKKELESEPESEDEFEKITFKRGVHGKGENMISKHDILLNNRHNALKVMKFPPEFETGDSHSIDMRIPNKVFNELKLHSLSEEKKYNRLHDKQDKATSEMSLDPKTRLILFKLVNADILESIGGIISTGKEATIFYAPGGQSDDSDNTGGKKIPKECVVKVFKTTLNEFKTRDKYIKDDYRFSYRYKHLNPQKIVKLWAEKEMLNLNKMRRCKIRCPEVVLLKKHVLVMEFLGEASVPAPKLKEARLDEKQLNSAYEQSIQFIKDIYTNCNLVHTDFNQFNLLWHQERVWVIDVSQAVEVNHPMSLEFLFRDCTNISSFFRTRNVESVKTGEELFREVTGMKLEGEGETFLSNLQGYLKDKRNELSALATDRQSEKYNFDYHFEKSQEKRANKENRSENDQENSDNEDDDDDDSSGLSD